jgi:multiple sugar transport system substrate-binding protein
MAIGFACLCLLAACGGEGADRAQEKADDNAAKVEKTEPVTLNIFNTRAEVRDNWDVLFTKPLQTKYPHITVTELEGKLEEVVASGTSIDLWITPEVNLGEFIQIDLADDIEPLMKAANMNLNRFEPVVIQTIRNHSKDGKQLLGLPFYLQFTALYYNKDIFDSLGVPYPKDGMKWDDAVQLARKVSGTHDGREIKGFHPDQIQRLANPFGISQVDPKTNKAVVNNDKYRRAFDLSKQFFSIPGNMPKNAAAVNGSPLNMFTKDKLLSMYLSVNRFSNLQGSDVNWDIAQTPYYPELPNVGGIVDSFMIGVAKTSKHKSDAFKVIETFTSDDVQVHSAKTFGYVSPLTNPKAKEQYGADIAILKGKNVQAIFKSKLVPHDPLSIYRSDAQKILFEEHAKFIMDQQDANTALRVADERINAKLAELSK